MQSLSENILSRIKDSNDIVDVISEKVHLKKAGKSYKGLCPFHSEKTPSFIVSSDKQYYHCFGCGEGGDVFTFLVKYDNISFFEAATALAARAGIAIPKTEKYADKAREALNEKLFAINDDAAAFFVSNLSSGFGAACLDYLKKRGITAETIKTFKIGCAPDSWDSLLGHLKKKGHPAELMEKAGLIIKKEGQSGYYDRFRKRVIFPIFSAGGNVIGFGGRVMDDSLPKYLNSPETPIFNKGHNLYALNLAKETARRQGYLIVVEGYLDAITPHQAGIANVSATLGTALTDNHLRLIKRYVKKVVLIFDPDEAGVKAVLRGLELFIKTDMKVNVVALPDKSDPDSFVRKHGREAFLKELKKSVKILDFFINYTVDSTKISSIDDKVAIVNETLPKISMVKNRIERDYYIKKLSEKLKIDENLLRQEMVSEISGHAHDRGAVRGALRSAVKPVAAKAEETLLRLMISDERVARYVKQVMKPDDFTNGTIKRIISTLFESLENNVEIKIDNIVKSGDDEAKSIISKLLVDEIPYSEEELHRAYKDCILKIQNDGIKAKMNEIRNLIAQAVREKNEKLKEELLIEYAGIEKIKNELKNKILP